jgi:hypothetical protein
MASGSLNMTFEQLLQLEKDVKDYIDRNDIVQKNKKKYFMKGRIKKI